MAIAHATAEAIEAAEVAFRDVPADHSFATQIERLATSGIIAGCPDDTFQPLDRITQEAMAAFNYRYAGEPGLTPPGETPFSDVSMEHKVVEIAWLELLDIAEVYDDGSFRPLNRITREAMAAFFFRLHQLTSDRDLIAVD